MSRGLLLIACVALLGACAALPAVTPVSPEEKSDFRRQCRAVFPEGDWQLVHTIAVKAPGGYDGVLIGVTRAYADAHRIECALMTVEGFVLFEAQSNGTAIIDRAVTPFDAPAFARGLLDDVKLMFLLPAGNPVEVGRLESGESICRYETGGRRTVDIIRLPNGQTEIRLYDDRQLNRIVSVTTAADDAPGLQPPQHVKLTALGWAGYELTMTLIDAVPLNE